MSGSKYLRSALFLPAVLFVVSLLAVAGHPEEAFANTANISCSKPGQNGTVTVVVEVRKAGGTVRQISWNAAILSTDTAEQKAEKIRNAGPPADPDITVGGAGNVVSATTKIAGDKITKMGFAHDGTNEKEATNVFALAPEENVGMFSLRGTASGGAGRFVEVTYQGVTKRANTTAGMTGAQIEDQLLSAFTAAGVMCQISNVDPVPGLGTDGRYVSFVNATPTAMTVEITDPGIVGDLHLLLARTRVPTLSKWGLAALVVVLAGIALITIQRRRVHAGA
jgi:hypothetical protein